MTWLSGRRRRAVHAELEAALHPLGIAVDLVVLLPIGRIHRIGTPQRRGVGLATLIQMAVGAVHAVADVLGRMLLRVDKDGSPLLNQFAIGVARQVLFLGRLEVALTGTLGRLLSQLGLIVHLDLGGQHRATHGQRQQRRKQMRVH